MSNTAAKESVGLHEDESISTRNEASEHCANRHKRVKERKKAVKSSVPESTSQEPSAASTTTGSGCSTPGTGDLAAPPVQTFTSVSPFARCMAYRNFLIATKCHPGDAEVETGDLYQCMDQHSELFIHSSLAGRHS